MMTVYGKYTNAIVYADILDDKTKEQIKVLVDQDFMKDAINLLLINYQLAFQHK